MREMSDTEKWCLVSSELKLLAVYHDLSVINYMRYDVNIITMKIYGWFAMTGSTCIQQLFYVKILHAFHLIFKLRYCIPKSML